MLKSSILRWLLLFGLTVASANAQEVSGLLRDVTRQGISNIAVQAYVFDSGSFTQMVTTTDLEGRFGFAPQPGSWSVFVQASDLNRLGYLDVVPTSLFLSNQSKHLRLTTRQLDLTHRITGRLTDDRGWALSGTPLRAFILENGQRFETNIVTGFDGSFSLAASPALWRVELALSIGPGNHVFPDFEVAVELTNQETQVTMVAPRATSTITGVASNLAGFEIVAECEAYGNRYVQATYPWSFNGTFALPVFNGVWTVSVTNRNLGTQTSRAPPPPIIVAVTNSTVQLEFNGADRPSRETLEVRPVTPTGAPITNASVSAFSELWFYSSPPPLPGLPPTDPTVTRLQLEDGRWTVSARTFDSGSGLAWNVSLDVTVPLNGASNLSLVLPQEGQGPRIRGVVRDTTGALLPGKQIALYATEQATNYSASIVTDTNGHFALHVRPGRWLLTLWDFLPCPAVLDINVADTDEQVELVACPLPARTLPVEFTAQDESSPPDVDFQVSFSSATAFFITNVLPRHPMVTLLNAGLWTAQLSPNWSTFRNDPYELLPTLKFQHPQSDPATLVLVARTASARIEGRLRDERGRLLTTGYATARANIGGTNYSVSGQVASGYFSLHVIPGEWEVAVSTWRYPSFASFGAVPGRNPRTRPSQPYADPPPQILRVTNGLNTCEFVPHDLPQRGTLAVSVIREDGSALDGTLVSVSHASPDEPAEVDSNGMVQFDVLPGTNAISVSWGWRAIQWDPFVFPSISLNLSAASNHVVLVARAPTACLRGRVVDFEGNPLGLPFNAWTQVDGTNYTSSACPDSRKDYCLPVIPGAWEVVVPDWAVNGLGFRSSSSRTVVVPVSGAPPTVDFVLETIVGDFRHAQWMAPTITSAGKLQLELRTQTMLTWRLERSDDLKQWSAWSTVTTSNGVARVPLPGSSSGRSVFFRAAWVE